MPYNFLFFSPETYFTCGAGDRARVKDVSSRVSKALGTISDKRKLVEQEIQELGSVNTSDPVERAVGLWGHGWSILLLRTVFGSPILRIRVNAHFVVQVIGPPGYPWARLLSGS